MPSHLPSSERRPIRLAFVVSHPIQYYVPLYRRLAARSDVEIKVFYTWHAAQEPVLDHGFGKKIAWDIPLADGYPFEQVPNTSSRPGTNSFWGLRNPSLMNRVEAWKPNAVHLTGYSYASHLGLMRGMVNKNIPILFRGDSHLLDERAGFKSALKRIVLKKIFSWLRAFLYVGEHNKEYYRSFGVPEEKLFYCPHSIEVDRFAEPSVELEQKALEWRREFKISQNTTVGLFAGKFETKKRPVELMKWALASEDKDWILVITGNGEHEVEVRRIASSYPDRFRILPFQNQSQMPVLYRLGDFLILPSAYGETWGLAVNEAQACGRPALVSDRVGCAPEMIIPGVTGEIFASDASASAPPSLISQLPSSAASLLQPPISAFSFPVAFTRMLAQLRSGGYSRERILNHARLFDISENEATLMDCLQAAAE